MNECEILEIYLEVFKKQCIENVDFWLPFIASLCQKIKILENHISKNSQSLKERVKKFALENKEELQKLTQRQIAQKLNTSKKSLPKIQKEHKNAGFIKTQKGKIIIV